MGSIGSKHQQADAVPCDAGKSFAKFEGKRIAAVIVQGGVERVFKGTAHFQRDDLLGNVVRVDLEDPLSGNPCIIFSESSYTGSIFPGVGYGCDYCFRPAEDVKKAAKPLKKPHGRRRFR